MWKEVAVAYLRYHTGIWCNRLIKTIVLEQPVSRLKFELRTSWLQSKGANHTWLWWQVTIM